MLALVISCCSRAHRNPSLRVRKVSSGIIATSDSEWFRLLKCSETPDLSDSEVCRIR